jgi:hypothetical protein
MSVYAMAQFSTPVGIQASTQTLLQKGRPFVLRRMIGHVGYELISPGFAR